MNNLTDKLTIMVVDDDEGIRELFKINLNKLGHESLSSDNAAQDFTLYQESIDNGKPIDGLIVDLSLPGSLGGKEIADKIRELNPSVKVLVASGNTGAPEMIRFKEYGFDGAIQKFFKREEIKLVLDAVFSG